MKNRRDISQKQADHVKRIVKNNLKETILLLIQNDNYELNFPRNIFNNNPVNNFKFKNIKLRLSKIY